MKKEMKKEMRLIDANALLENLGEEPMVWSDGEAEIQERNDWQRFKACVEAQDTVDAVEVVHGRWVLQRYYGGVRKGMVARVICSECGYPNEKTNYCPQCGSDMRERKDNENP